MTAFNSIRCKLHEVGQTSAANRSLQRAEVSTIDRNSERPFVKAVASTARNQAGRSTAHFPRFRTIFRVSVQEVAKITAVSTPPAGRPHGTSAVTQPASFDLTDAP
jgi:hypothetical protein